MPLLVCYLAYVFSVLHLLQCLWHFLFWDLIHKCNSSQLLGTYLETVSLFCYLYCIYQTVHFFHAGVKMMHVSLYYHFLCFLILYLSSQLFKSRSLFITFFPRYHFLSFRIPPPIFLLPPSLPTCLTQYLLCRCPHCRAQHIPRPILVLH